MTYDRTLPDLATYCPQNWARRPTISITCDQSFTHVENYPLNGVGSKEFEPRGLGRIESSPINGHDCWGCAG
ncbi:MAG: hypothetical protein JSW61_03075 [Candidatus Thorarchaeota archaeon]|nr:MAG: hypothetical protein JSW61_03075 [Candidatus Thorarchaeota archaeon]